MVDTTVHNRQHNDEVEVEMKNMNHSWGTIQRLASDRQGWRSFVAAIYATWLDGSKE